MKRLKEGSLVSVKLKNLPWLYYPGREIRGYYLGKYKDLLIIFPDSAHLPNKKSKDYNMQIATHSYYLLPQIIKSIKSN
jgi:hypothetical protein